jgi:hypothetical protein
LAAAEQAVDEDEVGGDEILHDGITWKVGSLEDGLSAFAYLAEYIMILRPVQSSISPPIV